MEAKVPTPWAITHTLLIQGCLKLALLDLGNVIQSELTWPQWYQSFKGSLVRTWPVSFKFNKIQDYIM